MTHRPMTHRDFVAAIAAVCVAWTASESPAQINESNWVSTLTGAQNWQVNGNWVPGTAFPNDPGRVDGDIATISNVVGANLSVALGANLNLNVGPTDVTVAALRLGGTAGAVTTTVSSTGGRLVFENYELNNDTNPMSVIPAFNSSRALIVSGGVAGSNNVISAPVFLNNESLDIGSDGVNATANDLTISGPITFLDADSTTAINLRAAGRTLTVTGPVTVDDTFTAATNNPVDLAFNDSPESGGTLRLEGVISGTGSFQVGPRPRTLTNPTNSTVYISGNNTNTGGFWHGLTTVVLQSDTALGTGVVKQQSNTGTLGANFVSDNDARVISNPMQLAQFVTIKGENSLTWAGDVAQTNSRGWINLLPEGKTFFLTGTQSADDQSPADANPLPGGDTPYNFDGSGKTVVTGLLKNHADDEPVSRSFGKRGTGAVYLQGSVQGTPNLSTYSGFTFVQGGNLHAATLADLGSTIAIKSTGGAIGLDNGTVTGPDAAGFLSKLNNRAQAPLTIQGDLKRTDDFASGSLMLAASESAVNLNFTAGNLLNAADMSVAAPEQGMSYTGTITPANNTYRLGGGSGVLTLPNANQLTGTRSVVVMNGHDFGTRQGLGGVRVTALNNYTGATTIQGRTMTTNQDAALVDGAVPAAGQFNGSTLTVTNLANGGVASGIGSSSSAATNLVLQGGTLRYEGAATSTDRLFTIGTRGATLNASGTGPVAFTNAGALAIDTAEARSGVTSGLAFGFENGATAASTSIAYNIGDTSDLVPGMQIAGNFLTESATDADTTITITGIQSPTRVAFSDPIGLFTNFAGASSNLTFIDVERTFTLTGSNSGNNVLRPSIGNSATNVVNVAKEGTGKWILDGANTYTGDTLVSAGTLGVRNGVGTLAAGTDLTLAAGASLAFEIAGATSADLLTATGIATLAGSIDVSLLGGYTPSNGATFDILNASSVVDSGITLTGASGFTSSIVGGNILRLTFSGATSLPGDANSDGKVDLLDLDILGSNFGNTPATLAQGDFNGDNRVDLLDLDILGSNFGAMAATALAVPEPSAAIVGLLMVASALATGRRQG